MYIYVYIMKILDMYIYYKYIIKIIKARNHTCISEF